ncbi:MAG: hypothetical protein GY935_20190 [Gammaproteobacteria bacterium]|nr:hypothetical protein [Gammaproteobacteria bacterium]
MNSKRCLTIYFMDGSEMSLNFPKQGGNPLLLAKRVQEAIDASQIAIEIDDHLYVIPTNNIKYLHVSPMPEELPETVIRGGSLRN